MAHYNCFMKPHHWRRKVRILIHKIAQINHGQISSTNEIGRWIYFISSLNQTKTILEIGTWNGKGSSRLIAQGVVRRGGEPPTVLGFEINPRMVAKAKKSLRKYPFFQVVWGSLVRVDDLLSHDLQNQEQAWLQQDRKWISAAPELTKLIPEEINFCILDGGEFSTYPEFVLLEQKINGYLLLDDTETRKCSRIMHELESSDRFKLIWSSSERNGAALFKSTSF